MARDDAEPELERELFVRALLPTLRGEGAARLAAMLEAREVAAGTQLFVEGEPSEEFFFLVEGQVVMEASGLPSWRFGPRSLLGTLDMMAARPHRRSCRTTQPSRVLAGRTAAWLDLFDEDPIMGEGAIASIAQRLHALSTELGHPQPPAPREFESELVPPLAIHERTLALRDTPLLSRASTQATASLAQVAEEVPLAAGAELFARGAAERALYAVASGVVLSTPPEGRPMPFGASQFLSPAAALSGSLDTYSARAESDAIVLKIREEDYYDQSDEHPDLSRAALAYLALELERLMNLRPPTG